MSETSTKTSDVYLAPTNIEPMTKEQLAEISNLIKECTNFVDTTKKTLSIPFAAFERVRQWRVKRRESKAMELCDTLIPRVKTVEGSLRGTIASTVERKGALREQSKFLLARLNSCIEYNSAALVEITPVVEETRELVTQLSDMLTSVKRMINFNNEVLRLRNVQNAGRHRPNGYGGGQFARSAAALFRPVTDEDLQRDAEYTPLSVRLNTLRELREKYVSILSALLESRESYQTNYDNAMQCYKVVCDLLRLDKQPVLLHGTPSTIVKPKRSSYTFAFSQMLSNGSVGTDTEDQLEFTKAIDLPKSKELSKSNSGTGGQQDGIYIGENEPLIPFFDHKGCADCSCVITMTQDCTSAFEEIHNIQVEATKQLSLLVEVRERMHEVMENVATYNQQLSGGATSEEGVAAES